MLYFRPWGVCIQFCQRVIVLFILPIRTQIDRLLFNKDRLPTLSRPYSLYVTAPEGQSPQGPATLFHNCQLQMTNTDMSPLLRSQPCSPPGVRTVWSIQGVLHLPPDAYCSVLVPVLSRPLPAAVCWCVGLIIFAHCRHQHLPLLATRGQDHVIPRQWCDWTLRLICFRNIILTIFRFSIEKSTQVAFHWVQTYEQVRYIGDFPIHSSVLIRTYQLFESIGRDYYYDMRAGTTGVALTLV